MNLDCNIRNILVSLYIARETRFVTAAFELLGYIY